jgi:hypothetical protein
MMSIGILMTSRLAADARTLLVHPQCNFRSLVRKEMGGEVLIGVGRPRPVLGGIVVDDEPAEVLTTRDLEKMLKIPRKTQMDLRARGGFIPYFFVGHKVLYRKEAVLLWIREQESKAAGGADGRA